MPLGGKYAASLRPPSPRNRQCGARTRKGSPCRQWALPGKTRCKLHGGLSTGPKFWDGKEKSLEARIEGRHHWVEWMKSQGLKCPCGRKPKGAPGIVLTGNEALDRKAMHREELRLQRARRREIEERTLRDRLEHEQEERARAERDRLLGVRSASPVMTHGALAHTGMVNWDRVMERERIRLLVAQAEAAWWRNGGWGDLEAGPMPRKQGVLDDPRMRRRFTADDFTAGIKKS